MKLHVLKNCKCGSVCQSRVSVSMRKPRGLSQVNELLTRKRRRRISSPWLPNLFADISFWTLPYWAVKEQTIGKCNRQHHLLVIHHICQHKKTEVKQRTHKLLVKEVSHDTSFRDIDKDSAFAMLSQRFMVCVLQVWRYNSCEREREREYDYMTSEVDWRTKDPLS